MYSAGKMSGENVDSYSIKGKNDKSIKKSQTKSVSSSKNGKNKLKSVEPIIDYFSMPNDEKKTKKSRKSISDNKSQKSSKSNKSSSKSSYYAIYSHKKKNEYKPTNFEANK